MTWCSTNQIAIAVGEAEGIKLVGAAESSRIRAIGEAEAQAMKRRAQAYKDYGKAAVTSLIMDALPKVWLHAF
jgi:flotillin